LEGDKGTEEKRREKRRMKEDQEEKLEEEEIEFQLNKIKKEKVIEVDGIVGEA